MRRLIFATALAIAAAFPAAADTSRPVIDVHIHYSEDAWAMLPPP